MTTQSNEYLQEDCKIDSDLINAYSDAYLNPENKVILHIETSWGSNDVDLTDAVKAAETVTTLYLSPKNGTKTGLSFDKEGGTTDTIPGDDLSKIISLSKLKDVSVSGINNQDVLVYDSSTNTWKPYSFKTNVIDKIADIYQNITNINNAITSINNDITNLKNRVSTIETKLTPPTGSPSNVKVAFGNINLYSDYANNNSKNSGLYTHALNTDVTNDEYFA